MHAAFAPERLSAIATDRIRLLPACRWGCRDRRPSRMPANPGKTFAQRLYHPASSARAQAEPAPAIPSPHEQFRCYLCNLCRERELARIRRTLKNIWLRDRGGQLNQRVPRFPKGRWVLVYSSGFGAARVGRSAVTTVPQQESELAHHCYRRSIGYCRLCECNEGRGNRFPHRTTRLAHLDCSGAGGLRPG